MAGWLSSGGVDQIILAVNHLSERLKIEVGRSMGGSRVAFSVEESPLGTAGPVRLAANLLGKDEPFLVMNGDIVSNIDIRGMLALHQEKEADATIALVSVRDSSPYGSVLADSKGIVRKFEEKSDALSPATLINAGVYVLNPSVVSSIPVGRTFSLERDVFPKLVEEGGVLSWIHNGFWYDIGRISEYVRTNREILEKQQRKADELRVNEERGRHIVPPVHLGMNARLGVGARVGPLTILSDNVTVGDDAMVRNSIVFEETTIGEKTIIDDAVIGEKVVIGKGSRIGSGSMIAGQLSVPAGSVLPPNSVVLC
jgi:mannose-1-phosphate guanylyltransferase